MNVKKALTKMQELVRDMAQQDARERLISYSIVKTIMHELDEVAELRAIPNYAVYRHELLWSCKSICGLGDGDNHSANQHSLWASCAIDKLKSVQCFDIFNIKQKLTP